VAGPFTGGQNVAHEPLHFDVAAVSGTNQYKVKPLPLVTTVAPPILAVFSALLPAAGALEAGVALEAAPPELVEPDELLQAAITKAAASPAGTSHTLFITYPPRPPLRGRQPVTRPRFTQLPANLLAGPGQLTGAIKAKPPAALQSVAGGRLAWRADEILCKAFYIGAYAAASARWRGPYRTGR
jgi:hypothetical protein